MEPVPEAADRSPPTYQPINYSRSLGKSFTFLACLILSVAAWFISLVSQAYVTNRVGNDTIGTLWFGIILQLGVIIAIIICFLGESLFQYGITISIFAALATSYGAEGVHHNIFHGTMAQKAVSAGWIITCIVDVIWILILSCEPTSYVYRFVANNGRVESLQSSGATIPQMDAFAQKYAEGVPSALPLQGLGPDGGAGPGAGFRGSGVRGSASDLESHRRRSAGIWGTPPQTPGGAGSMRNKPPAPDFNATGPPVDRHDVGSGTRGSGSNMEQVARPPSSLPTTADVTANPQVIARAQALFDYNASPTDPYELTFTKGDILDIFDKSGKWWEAMKSNGAKGIAPSNYLEIL